MATTAPTSAPSCTLPHHVLSSTTRPLSPPHSFIKRRLGAVFKFFYFDNARLTELLEKDLHSFLFRSPHWVDLCKLAAPPNAADFPECRPQPPPRAAPCFAPQPPPHPAPVPPDSHAHHCEGAGCLKVPAKCLSGVYFAAIPRSAIINLLELGHMSVHTQPLPIALRPLQPHVGAALALEAAPPAPRAAAPPAPRPQQRQAEVRLGRSLRRRPRGTEIPFAVGCCGRLLLRAGSF